MYSGGTAEVQRRYSVGTPEVQRRYSGGTAGCIVYLVEAEVSPLISRIAIQNKESRVHNIPKRVTVVDPR